jgi:hypothetical protein
MVTMKDPRPYEAVAAVIALALWTAIVAVATVRGGRWAWSVPYHLISTPMAVLVTFLLADYRFARKKSASYGTLFVGPSVSALVALVAYKTYSLGWRALSTAYWLDRKGSLVTVPEFVHIAGLSVLPAVAIVVYLQRRYRRHGAELT